MKVLVVEDEVALAGFIKQALVEAGYEAETVQRAADGIASVEASPPDLIVLDALLPDFDGFEFLRRLRGRFDIPVLMLTALAGVDDRVKGLDSGADDYLAKPFRLEEFLARVRALLRRSRLDITTVTCGDLQMDLISRRVTRNGHAIFLSTTEFSILELLGRNMDSPISKSTLLERVWDDGDRDPNLIEVYISYLRTKMERGGLSRLIHTVRGKGYMLSTTEP